VTQNNTVLEKDSASSTKGGIWEVEASPSLPTPGGPGIMSKMTLVAKWHQIPSHGYNKVHECDRRTDGRIDHAMETSIVIIPVEKFGGPSPQKLGAKSVQKFGMISDNFRLRSRISPERITTSVQAENGVINYDASHVR